MFFGSNGPKEHSLAPPLREPTLRALDADTGRITDAHTFLQDLPGYSHAKLLGKMLREIGPFRDIAARI
jgi:hypothetical protein